MSGLDYRAKEWYPTPKPIKVKNPKVRARYEMNLLPSERAYAHLTPNKSILFAHIRDPPQWFAGTFVRLTDYDAAGNRNVVIKLLDKSDSIVLPVRDMYRNTEVYSAQLPPMTDAQRVAQVVQYGKLPAGVEIDLAEMLTGRRPKGFLPPRKNPPGEAVRKSEEELNRSAEKHLEELKKLERNQLSSLEEKDSVPSETSQMHKALGGRTRRAKGRKYRKQAGLPLTRRVRSSSGSSSLRESGRKHQ